MPYQTQFRVEELREGKRAIVKYRTIFSGRTIDHNDLFVKVRELGEHDVKILLNIFENAEKYDNLKTLVHEAYFIENSNMRVNELLRKMHHITHPDYWKEIPSSSDSAPTTNEEVRK